MEQKPQKESRYKAFVTVSEKRKSEKEGKTWTLQGIQFLLGSPSSFFFWAVAFFFSYYLGMGSLKSVREENIVNIAMGLVNGDIT